MPRVSFSEHETAPFVMLFCVLTQVENQKTIT